MEPYAVDWTASSLVFDIRRFSTHDGPGIRTTVFTKGCPLRCLWCQNPEGLVTERRLFYFRDKCIGCGSCIVACPVKAITRTGEKISGVKVAGAKFNTEKSTGEKVAGEKIAGEYITIDRLKCNLCGACVEVCPPQALSFDSKAMTVREVVDEISKDLNFYRESGGVTLSGGDPLNQVHFTENLLKACRNLGIHTAIETSLYASPAVLARILPLLKLLIADFKVFDPGNHRAWTNVDQRVILENFDEVFKNWFNPGQLDLLVRIPLIPGYTATTENIRAIGEYCVQRAPKVRMELLNYNPLARNKYTLLDQPFLYEQNPRMYNSEEMAAFNQILLDLGIDVIPYDHQ